jgi:hypothetical protein
MTGLFSWLRRSVRDAVVGGVADAFADLHRAEDVPALLLEHRAAEPEALPPPEDRAEAGNGKVRGRK